MEIATKEILQARKMNDHLEISPDELVEANFVRNRYREQFACHYIPDINIFREKIDKATDQIKIQQYSKKVYALTSQFSHIAFELPNSLEAYDSNYQLNYQTFMPYPLIQKNFRFSVIVDKYNIKDLFFQNGTFFSHSEVCYYIFVPKQDCSTISYLQGKGYSILGERGDNLKIGHEFDISVPFNNSDEIFFFSKHFLYFHIYNLLQGCEKVPGVFAAILNKLITTLKKIFEGFFQIVGNFQQFTLKESINSYISTQRVYDKYIFSQVREVNKIHKRFLNIMEIANVTG
jgi:hypothetical protein